MFSTHILYEAAGRPKIDGTAPLSGHCSICGDCLVEGIPIKTAIKDSFNDHDKLLRPDGQGFCCACAFSFQEQLVINGRDRQKFRTYTHLVDKIWTPCTKGQKPFIKEFLLASHSGPWLACIADSGQKHLLFKCPVNIGDGDFRILFEERMIQTNRVDLASTLAPVDALIKMGASKAMIETGSYYQAFLKKVDLDEWAQAEEQIQPLRGRPVFVLALFLAQKEVEIEPDSDRHSEDDRSGPQIGELGSLGKQETDVLGDAGERNQGGGLHDRPAEISQRSLFEDADS